MNFDIKQSVLTSELKKRIYACFSKHAISSTGIDGLSQEAVSFEMHSNNKLIGVVVVQIFWGQLHIKYLVIEEGYRSQGYATKLMESAFKYGKQQACQFTFVETMSFQAPEFYQKLGFKIELKRNGYEKGTSMYYLCKNLVE
ncbi:MAG: GNAT family N-acetyltransferase [Rickettsiaceae bacterium]